MAETKTTAVVENPQQKNAELTINNAFVDSLASQLEKKKEYGLSFPPNYNVSNALNAAYLMLQETKDSNKNLVLKSCTQQSIASSLMNMAVQALNPIKKQCYFVAYGDKLTLMRSYQGTMAVAKRVGARKIVAEVIYADDVFAYHIQDGIKVIDKHEQDFKNIDNAKIVGAYAIVTTDDYTYAEIMNISQIKKAWGKGYGYKDGSGVHSEFADQMAKKTVIGRACKNLINSSDDGYLTEAFDDTTDNEEIDGVSENVKHDIESYSNSIDFEEITESVAEGSKEIITETAVNEKAPY